MCAARCALAGADGEGVEGRLPHSVAGATGRREAGVLGARGAVRSPCIREHALSAARDRAQGVDTFMNAMIDKSALVTKHWKLQTAPEADSPFFFLSVRHYSLTKMYVLSVSGLLVLVNGKVSARASAGPCLVLRSAL